MRAGLAAALTAALLLSAPAAVAIDPPPLPPIIIEDLYGYVSDAESGLKLGGVTVDLDQDTSWSVRPTPQPSLVLIADR